MKPETTLKELLKPPFRVNNCHVYTSHPMYLLHIADVGFSKELRDGILEFVIQALNKKWEHDFSKPLKWLLDDNYYESLICPYCGIEYKFETLPNWENYSYCPHCGKQVSPPEEAQEK